MEMCYSGALVMPSNYALMSEDEMAYVNGGIKVMPTWLLAGIVNLAIDVLVAGGPRMAAKFFSKKVKEIGAKRTGLLFSEILKKKLLFKHIGAGLAAGVCNLAVIGITVLTWATDPGGSLASYMNSRDKDPTNSWIDI